MKIIKTANNKQRLVLTKKEWQDIGKKAGWMKKAGLYEYPTQILEETLGNEEIEKISKDLVNIIEKSIFPLVKNSAIKSINSDPNNAPEFKKMAIDQIDIAMRDTLRNVNYHVENIIKEIANNIVNRIDNYSVAAQEYDSPNGGYRDY